MPVAARGRGAPQQTVAMWRLLRLALRDRCGFDQNWSLNWLTRWWLTIKCLVSVLLRYEIRDDFNVFDSVEVAYFDWHETYTYANGRGAEGQILVTPRYGFGYEITETAWP